MTSRCKRSFVVSVPLPGFSGLRPELECQQQAQGCFSPVAGIQWVETGVSHECPGCGLVSVPLPGFSGLRLYRQKDW